MSHLPFIAISYALAFVVLVGFGLGAWLRVMAARHQLAAIDPRQERAGRERTRRARADRDTPEPAGDGA